MYITKNYSLNENDKENLGKWRVCDSKKGI
jgi:hypothetical protein